MFEKKKRGGGLKRVFTPDIINSIESIVIDHPGYILQQIKNSLETETPGIDTSISSIDSCLHDLKKALKKIHGELDRVNDTTRIDSRKEYALWFDGFFNNDFSTAANVDETSFNLHINRYQGRSLRGTRAIANIPTVRGRSVSLIASMTVNGMGYCQVISHSSVNANIFSEYIRELC